MCSLLQHAQAALHQAMQHACMWVRWQAPCLGAGTCWRLLTETHAGQTWLCSLTCECPTCAPAPTLFVYDLPHLLHTVGEQGATMLSDPFNLSDTWKYL